MSLSLNSCHRHGTYGLRSLCTGRHAARVSTTKEVCVLGGFVQNMRGSPYRLTEVTLSSVWKERLGRPVRGHQRHPKLESQTPQTRAAWVTGELFSALWVGKDTPEPQSGDTQAKTSPLKTTLTLNKARNKIWFLSLGTESSITRTTLRSSESFESEIIPL